MKRNDEKFHEDRWLNDLPLQTENLAFDPEEMLACAACARANPPTRLKCIYCAAELPLSEKHQETQKSQKLNLRKLENWEKGFNLICVSSGAKAIDYGEIGELLDLPAEAAEKIIESKKPLPVLRAETQSEAKIIAESLQPAGIETKIISDESLMPEILPQRLRGLTFKEDSLELILFNTGEIVKIFNDELILIIPGIIFERKTEAIEKRKKGEMKILEASETASDENLIDIYSRHNALGYRILTKGFDYSCLGMEKGILAVENIKKLRKKLKQFAPGAKLIDDYLQIREILGSVWEIENRRNAKGLTRHSYNKFDFANVESSSNLQQFTKYSRLQWQMV